MRFRATIDLNSKKQRHVLAVEGAKTAETRQRRIAKAVDELRASPR